MENSKIVKNSYELRADLSDLERRWQQIDANSPYKKHPEVRHEKRRQVAITCTNLIYTGLDSMINRRGNDFQSADIAARSYWRSTDTPTNISLAYGRLVRCPVRVTMSYGKRVDKNVTSENTLVQTR